MQFSAKKLKNNSTFESWRTSLGKILDLPLQAMSTSLTATFVAMRCVKKLALSHLLTHDDFAVADPPQGTVF